MRFKKILVFILFIVGSMSLVLTAVADEPNEPGIVDPDDAAGNVETAVTNNFLNSFTTITQKGDYSAAGIAMRTTGAGPITISDIPAGATVTHAYLFWAIMDNVEGASFTDGAIDGNPISGVFIGSSDDPCWTPYANTTFAYRADVTALISGNGIYNLSGFATGSDLFTPPLNEGASLVVVYNDPAAPNTNIVIYDGSATVDGVVVETVTTMTIPEIGAAGVGKTTYIVADGQTAAPDDTLFNGIDISMVLNGDDFDGSDGAYWDTDTYDVSAFVSVGDTAVDAGIRQVGDCLVHIAQVFSSSAAAEPYIIDIRPGDFPNIIYLHHDKTTKVAILSSPSFDAPAEMDQTSLTFGHNGTEDSLHLRGHARVPSCRAHDENNDGLPDLTCHFDTLDTGLVPGDTEGVLMGLLLDGTPFMGTDSVIIRPGIR
jgi:hypothetical protein